MNHDTGTPAGRVRADEGAWISGPSLPPGTAGRIFSMWLAGRPVAAIAEAEGVAPWVVTAVVEELASR